MFGFGFGFSIGNGGAGAYVPTNAMAAAYIEANSFTDNELKRIIDTRIIQMAAAVDMTKVSLMKFYITESTTNSTALTQCGMNVINPLTFVPSFINNPTANYSGIEYNGVNQYSEMNYNPNSDVKWALNSCTIMSYNGLTTGNSLMFGQRNTSIASNRNVFAQFISPSSASISLNDSAGAVTATGSNAVGFFGVTRNANNSTKYYNAKGTQITQTGVAPNGVPNILLVEGARRLNVGVQDAYTISRPQFQLFASAFTTGELAAFETIVNNMQGDLDLLFGLTGTNARKRY